MSSVARRYYERGLRSLESGDLDGAQESLRAAVDLAPTFGNARVAYAVAAAKAGDCPRAAQSLRTGIARAVTAKSAAAMWCTLGDVLTLGGDFLGAEDAFGHAASVPGFAARVASGRARVAGRLGRWDDLARYLIAATKTA